HEMGREERGRQAIEESRLGNEPPGRRKARATVLCHPPLIDQFHSNRADPGSIIGEEKIAAFRQRSRTYAHVGVQEQKSLSRSHGSALVAGGGETKVFLVRYDLQRQGSGEIVKLR